MVGKASAATALAVVLGGAGLGILGLSLTASASTPRASAPCVDERALRAVELLTYDPTGKNAIVVHDNGVPILESTLGSDRRDQVVGPRRYDGRTER